jgi:hypothetical protein
MSNITIPKKLESIIQAFYSETPQAAKKLVIQAAKAIYGSEEEKERFDLVSEYNPITNEQVEDICAFMQGIKPNDMLEAIIAAQIVVTHMLGMRKLARGYIDDQRLGLKMLQFSSESIAKLQKKRWGAVQNINIPYHGEKAQATQTVIPIQSLKE